MTKFIFKDTGEEIKVGDVVYYTGYHIIYTDGTRKALQTINSCEVKTISNLYINRNPENDIWDTVNEVMITLDYAKETLVIQDALFSSREACNDAIVVKALQKSISQEIFSIDDAVAIKDIQCIVASTRNKLA